MKKSVFAFGAVVFAAFLGNAMAGYYDAPVSAAYSSGKSPIEAGVMAELNDDAVSVCFEPGHIDLDVFSGYAWADDATGPFSEDGFTVGLGVQTFYTELLGFRLQGSYWDSENDVGAVSGSMILRYPLEWRGRQMAPYIYGGPGGLFSGDGNGEWTGHLGIGLDYRFDRIDCLGFIMDFRRTWADTSDGYYMLTAGLRISL